MKTNNLQIRRLGVGDVQLAREAFALMAAVFEEPSAELSDACVARLLGRPDFVALVAQSAATVVGGITAHVLPLTRREGAELFIYDLAVASPYQRQGIGRALVLGLQDEAKRLGIEVLFVPADNDDTHALEFYGALGGDAAPVTIFTFGETSASQSDSE